MIDQAKKSFSPAAERNKEPILDVLKEVLPKEGQILEVSSGSGQHVVHFAAALARLNWQPTELDPTNLTSIESYIRDSGLENISAPQILDASQSSWHHLKVDGMINCNMIHISPWKSCVGLFTGAGKIIRQGGVLFLYGPYFVEGKETAPSNLDFDRSLRQRNPEWGIRPLGDVIDLGNANGFEFKGAVSMPANNYSLIFNKV